MNDFTSLFRFKSWADAELLEALGAIDAASHPAEHKTAVRTVNHLHVVDQIFRGHLQGVPHGFEATNTPHTPALDELRQSVGAVDDWYVRYVDSLGEAHLAEEVRFTFTDGEAGRMTRQEILMHVLTHGGYGYAKEFHVERYLRESLVGRIAPVSPQMILCFIAEKVLGLPKSY